MAESLDIPMENLAMAIQIIGLEKLAKAVETIGIEKLADALRPEEIERLILALLQKFLPKRGLKLLRRSLETERKSRDSKDLLLSKLSSFPENFFGKSARGHSTSSACRPF